MNEEIKKPEGEEQKNTGEDNNERDKPESSSPIDRANLAAERLEKATEEAAKVTREGQEFEAKRILGGKTLAGQAPEKPKEVSPEEYAQQALEGKFDK